MASMPSHSPNDRPHLFRDFVLKELPTIRLLFSVIRNRLPASASLLTGRFWNKYAFHFILDQSRSQFDTRIASQLPRSPNFTTEFGTRFFLECVPDTLLSLFVPGEFQSRMQGAATSPFGPSVALRAGRFYFRIRDIQNVLKST